MKNEEIRAERYRTEKYSTYKRNPQQRVCLLFREDRALYVKKLAQSACIELDEREVKEIVSYFERLLPIFDSLQSQTDESAISAISQPARESSLRTDDAFVTSDPQPTLAAAARTKDGYFSTGPILN